MYYNKRLHPIFVRYAENIASNYNLSDLRYRLIYTAKCLGYLDCLFNKAHKLNKGFPVKDYMYLKNKLTAMLPPGINLY